MTGQTHQRSGDPAKSFALPQGDTSEPPRTPVTTATTNAEVMAAIFGELAGPERPMVVEIKGSPADGAAWRAKPWLPGRSIDDPRSNWYFTFSTFNPTEDGGYRRTKKQFARSYGFILDDIGTKSAPRSRLDACPPSYLIETSEGNYQAGYVFKEPYSEEARVEALMNALAQAGLTDPGAKGAATRLGRLPFATNRKRQLPFACRLIEWTPERRYTIEEVVERLELDVSSPHARAKQPAGNGVEPSAESDVYFPRQAENAVLAALRQRGLYKRPLGDQRHDITCPWVHEHTGALDGGTTYFEPSDVYPLGGFKCHHSHGQGKRITALLEFLGVTPQAAANRPTIRVSPGDLHRIVDVAERELAASGSHYQRGGLIVRVHTDPGTDETTIQPVKANALLRTLSSCAAWERLDGKSGQWVTCDPPTRHVNVLSDADGYLHLPVLIGVARQPYLRTDGSLVNKAGFDGTSGMFGAFDERQFSICEAPTRHEAGDALAELQGLLRDFELRTPADHSAALAALMTAALRPSLPAAPMFHVRANQIASGKSYLCNLIAAFAGAGRPSALAFPEKEEECAKVLLSTLLEAPPVLMFDNLTNDLRPFNSLCSALTEQYLSGRILGVSKMAKVPTRTLFLSSGNNVDASFDLTRRVVTIALDPQCEAPATRSFPRDPLREVRARRGHFVSLALTIVRAYLVAGAPNMGLKPLASYQDWSHLVRAPLAWLGQPDPATALFARMSEDPDRLLLGRLLAHWRGAFGTAPTGIRDVIRMTETRGQAEAADLAEAVREIAEDRGEVNSRRLGRWVSRHEGQIVQGLRFQRDTRSGGSERWRVVVVPGDKGVSSTPSQTDAALPETIVGQPF